MSWSSWLGSMLGIVVGVLFLLGVYAWVDCRDKR